MEPSKLPFDQISLEPADGLRIVEIVKQIAFEHPEKSISVQTVSQESGFHPKDVKNVLYLLLSYRMLKATYLPRHRSCDEILGGQEKSTEIIFEKARSGDFNWCVNCHEPVNGADDIQIQIIFWKPGTNVRK